MITKTIKVISQITCIVIVIMAYNNLTNSLPVAVKIQENAVIEEIKEDLTKLNADKRKVQEIANAVYTAHQSTGLNPKLIVSLMYTESNFKINAIGPQNRTKIRYKGLMQTPTATWFSDVDTLHGARILKQKLEISDFNLRKALALYKGGNNPVAFRQADQVLKLYSEL
ncbi:MAG TPA: lytic transglycosylase domain-containing protein [Candidatus Dojkabacteria bacterium]|nr:lytic transglycosylase domain-containing protein [Candidatus Dojkabacteria bacterium]